MFDGRPVALIDAMWRGFDRLGGVSPFICNRAEAQTFGDITGVERIVDSNRGRSLLIFQLYETGGG